MPSSRTLCAFLLALASCEGTLGTPTTQIGDDARDPGDESASGDGDQSAGGTNDGDEDQDSEPDDGDDDPDNSGPTQQRDAALGDADDPAWTHDAGPPDAGPAQPPPPPPPPVVRFVVLGDGGTGDDHQRAVAEGMRKVCAELGCEFAVYAGDNIYESSVSGVDDGQFDSKFEQPYADLDFPFYVALGNHDYGSNGTNLLPNDAQSSAQVEYTAHSGKWNMPHHYYTFRKGPLQFFAIDTNAIVLGRFRPQAEQQAWLDQAMAESDAPWKFVFGHHPYISNGEHGNADSEALRSVIEGSVCGRAQVYFSGHDHNREWLEPVCGTSFIVSGAASKLRDMNGDHQPTRYQDGKTRGFLWVEVDGNVLTGRFYDEAGELDYEDIVLR
jgi:hypothetical protein